MPEVGLFPLSIVLLPTERVPLHIFETRYKELISSCLAGDVPFGMVLTAAEQTYDVGTYAHVVEVLERFSDGRLNIIVEGGDRFRVLATHTERSYFTAEVTDYTDENPAPPAEVLDAFLGEFLGVVGQMGMDPPRVELDRNLSFRVAAELGLGLDEKQELLQLRSEAERLNKLSGWLPKAVLDARNHLVRRRAATNGHMGRILGR